MFSFIPKKKFDEKQISKFENLGTTLGKKLRSSKRFQKVYKKSTEFGNRNPEIIVGVSLSLALLSVGISVYNFYAASLPQSKPTSSERLIDINLSSHYDDSIRIAKDGIEQILIEAKDISDSIQTLLRKDKLTREDSIYVITQGKYLEDITNIIQKQR